MKLIKQSFEIWNQPAGLEGVYKQIERVGRVCYKSEDKITEDSAKGFVDRMIKSGHGAMLEHGTVYLFCPTEECVDSNGDVQDYNPLEKYQDNNYSALEDSNEGMYVTTNLRILAENGWLNDLKYLCEPTEYHERRITVHFVCDRGVSHEFVRHRTMSFAQESTRYCNYSKDKFGNELTFIIPCWTNIPEGDYGDIFNPKEPDITLASNEYAFIDILRESEKYYIELTNNGWKPQEARAVLPNSLKTELVMTGFVSDWKHFFRLRSRIAETGKPHPQAQELADPLMDEFVKRGIMETLL